MTPLPRVEINGAPATIEQLQYRALVNYGHYTAAQVRDRAIRGIDYHFARLNTANQELYGQPLPGERVRDLIRHALAEDITDASLRVDAFRPDGAPEVSVMVTLRPAIDAPAQPQSLHAVAYQRPLAHLKHAGSFGQIYHGLAAERAGFDEALLTGPGGEISEGSVCNVGFFDDDAVLWPATPHLVGTTMQLLDRELGHRGVPVRHRVLRLSDLSGLRGGFVANSRGVAPIARVDDVPLPLDNELMKVITEAYESAPWDLV